MNQLYIIHTSSVKYKLYDTSFISMRRYTNIPLPDELAKQIDEIIETSKWGYKTKSEFIKEAVRQKLIELDKLKRDFKKKK